MIPTGRASTSSTASAPTSPTVRTPPDFVSPDRAVILQIGNLVTKTEADRRNSTKNLKKCFTSENVETKSDRASKRMPYSPRKYASLPSTPRSCSETKRNAVPLRRASLFSDISYPTEDSYPRVSTSPTATTSNTPTATTSNTPTTAGSTSQSVKSTFSSASGATLSPDIGVFASSAVKTFFSPDIKDRDLPENPIHDSLVKRKHDSPGKRKHDSPAERMHASPAKKIHASPAKKIHASPARAGHDSLDKGIHLSPAEGLSENPDSRIQQEFVMKYPYCILPSASLGEAQDHSNIIRSPYETEHTFRKRVLTSQSTPFQSNVSEFAQTLVDCGEQTRTQESSGHPKITDQAEDILPDIATLNILPTDSLGEDESHLNTAFSQCEIKNISKNDAGIFQSMSFYQNASALYTSDNYGVQTETRADSRNPEITLQASNILQDVSLNTAEDSLLAIRKTSTDTGSFSPEAHCFSFKDSDSPKGQFSISPGSGAVADSEDFNNAMQSSKGSNQISIIHSRIVPKQLFPSTGDPGVSRYGYESWKDTTSLFRMIQDNFFPSSLKNLEATVRKPITHSGAVEPNSSNLPNNPEASNINPFDHALNVFKNLVRETISNFVKHFGSSEYAANRGNDTDNTSFAKKARDLLKTVPINIAYECKDFVLQFLEQAHVPVKYVMPGISQNEVGDYSSNLRSLHVAESLPEIKTSSVQSASNMTDNHETPIRNIADALYLARTSAELALTSILRRYRFSIYEASRETEIDVSTFADEIRTLLMRLPENIAPECKDFIDHFLIQASKIE